MSEEYNELYISSITHYEIGVGNRKSHYDYWTELSNNLLVLPFDRECSKNAIDIYLDLIRTNNIIDLADIFIGATAITHKIPIATLNIKHFERIKNLIIVK